MQSEETATVTRGAVMICWCFGRYRVCWSWLCGDDWFWLDWVTVMPALPLNGLPLQKPQTRTYAVYEITLFLNFVYGHVSFRFCAVFKRPHLHEGIGICLHTDSRKFYFWWNVRTSVNPIMVVQVWVDLNIHLQLVESCCFWVFPHSSQKKITIL